MKSFLKFLAVLTGIIFLSVVLAPLLYKVLPFKFERIFNRLIMIFSLAAIFIFVRFNRKMFESVGLFLPDAKNRGDFAAAFLAGVITLSLLVAVKIGLGVAFWRPEPVSLMSLFFQLLYILGAALLIGLIEEFFFRGVVFQALIRRFSWNVRMSVLATSLFYSLIHFVSHKKPFVGPEPTWIDSLRLVAAPFKSLVNWPEFWPAAVGLFIFGIILNGLVIWTKSLYPAMGLHAGCVFFIKAEGLFVDFSDVSNNIIFASKKMYDGILGWFFLLVMGYILWWVFQKRAVSR